MFSITNRYSQSCQYFDVFEATFDKYIGRAYAVSDVTHPLCRKHPPYNHQCCFQVVKFPYKREREAAGMLEFVVQPVSNAGFRRPLPECSHMQLKWLA